MPEKIEIHFGGILTEEHFYIYKQYCLPTWIEFFFKWLFWFYLGLTIVRWLSWFNLYSMIIKGLGNPRDIPLSFDEVISDVIGDVFIFICFLWLFFQSTKQNSKKAWQSNKLIHGNFSGVATEKTLFWNHPYGESRFPWDVMLKYREVKNIMMLYTEIDRALIIPRNFFYSEEDWQEFRQLVTSKVPKK
ncbi:hypothetical protein Sta7437_2553 [Stanieria cyanosphaera PCC 7437]|uniref:YcxB-like C-terminal domain-containing protein n=1 Tax=Stanieria cyanosphaera (strain ATCC 29371 / PCC 7437) TaxID=111780 RepID=K9XU18_STAC7|nr:YcxB family protein [Stanieria cyanosphaera]AFZ36085.1 hypothetical protein Sta7437_2553 [Stanieria cyanosphaera PCC 7437]